MINFKFLFKIDLVDINSIDFYFSDTYEKLETEPILTKRYPTEGEISHGAVEMSVDSAEIELLPNLFYAEAVIHLNDGTAIKAHARTLKHQEALLTTILNDGDEEIDVKFHVDESDVKYKSGQGIEIEDNIISIKAADDGLTSFINKEFTILPQSLGTDNTLRQNLTIGDEYPLASKEYVDNLTNDTLKNKIEVNITVENGIKTDAISCHDISVIRYKNKDLISNESLYLIPIINNEEQEYIDITEKAYNDVVNYDSIKFLVESNKTRHFTLIKENDVIRNRQYFKEVEVLTNSKQDKLTSGNGIDVSSDVVNVKLHDGISYLGFSQTSKGLLVDWRELGSSANFRTRLTLTDNANALASKSYVDNLISGTLKRLVVQSLPTEDIDTNTIYMILRSAPTTNNIYDEYMYINNAWELIGSTEVDLTNYYTKTESDNRYNAKLTVGNGIDITNDTISTKISGSYLYFAQGGLTINTTTLGTSYALRQELVNGDSTTYALQSKINSNNKLNADYIQDGSNYMVIPKPTAADAGKVLQVNSNGQPEWVTP